MSFFAIIIVALLGLVITFGLLIFQTGVLFFKRTDLSFYLLLGMFFSIVITVLLFNLDSYFQFLLTIEFLYFLAILNQIMTFFTIKKLVKMKDFYFNIEDRNLRMKNRFVVFVFGTTAVLYYFIFYLNLAKEVI